METLFPNLARHVLDRDALVFFDFEGTERSAHAIALAVVIIPKEPGTLDGEEKGISFSRYILTAERITPIITRLTGITNALLKKEGQPFDKVLLTFRELLSPYKKPLFISYGNNDIKILTRSINRTLAFERETEKLVLKNYFDFQNYIKDYLVSPKGQPLSVSKLMDFYSLSPAGEYHDPLVDSLSLRSIYSSFVKSADKTAEDVLSCYPNNRNLIAPAKRLADLLLAKKKVTIEDFRKEIKDSL